VANYDDDVPASYLLYAVGVIVVIAGIAVGACFMIFR
jgi:hypothetical protein